MNELEAGGMENGRAWVFRELARAESEAIHYVYDAGEIMGRAASTSRTGDLAAHSSLEASSSFADHYLERDG